MRVLRQVLNAILTVKEKLWNVFDAFNNDELYILNKTDVIQKYVDYKVDDINEFATIYTYEYHETIGNLDNLASKKKMHKEVYEMVQNLIKE